MIAGVQGPSFSSPSDRQICFFFLSSSIPFSFLISVSLSRPVSQVSLCAGWLRLEGRHRCMWPCTWISCHNIFRHQRCKWMCTNEGVNVCGGPPLHLWSVCVCVCVCACEHLCFLSLLYITGVHNISKITQKDLASGKLIAFKAFLDSHPGWCGERTVCQGD